jgi:hypothetical protein
LFLIAFDEFVSFIGKNEPGDFAFTLACRDCPAKSG